MTRNGRDCPALMVACCTLLLALLMERPSVAQPGRNVQIVASRDLKADGAMLHVDFAAGALDLSQDKVLAHIQSAADAVVAYYGRFPVSRDRILVVTWPDRGGVGGGTTWGDMA